MKVMVDELQVNQDVESFFLIVDPPQVRVSKKNTNYLVFKLSDRTGEIDARMWEVPADLDPAALKRMIVKVRGSVSEWQDVKQLSVQKIRPASDEEYEIGEFFERSERAPESMYSELMELLNNNIKDPQIHDLVTDVLSDNAIEYMRMPAAKSVHHAFIGGLIEHVLDMANLSLPIIQNYNLNGSLLLAGVVFHDIGKLFELKQDMGTTYTLGGTLLGHISQGMVLVAAACDKIRVPPLAKVAILHLIASHHGMLEYGSPKTPLMREAIALNLIDLLSSKMGICNRALKGGVNEEGLTDWVKQLDGPLFQLREINEET